MVRKLEKVKYQQSRENGRFFSSPTIIPAQARVLELPSEFYDILKIYYDEEFARQVQNSYQP